MKRTWIAATALAGLILASSDEAPARAELGKDRFELVDLSAWTLRSGELLIGPREVSLGIIDLLEIKSVYALSVFGAPNASIKWLIHDHQAIGIGVEAGVLHFDPALAGLDEAFSVTAVPLSLNVSGRPNDRLRLHATLELLLARPDTQAPDLILRLQRHLGPVGRLAARVGAEYRFGQHVAAVLELETPLLLHRPELRYRGEDDWPDFLRGTLSLHFVVESFNLRLGGGYGPSWLGRSGFFPTAELYFRIY